MDDDLLSIGRFARLTGISVGALRHYDELDLLRPADVDRFTGYRRYRREQVETGRIIARLRDLEVPLDEIRLVLAADDPALQRRRIAEHRSRIEARINRLTRVLHVLGQLSTGREPIVSDSITTDTATTELDAAAHRRLGVDLFNFTWTLIEKADRTPAETDEMIHAAHASRYHWSKAGTNANLGRGEWQIARVYSVLGSRRAGDVARSTLPRVRGGGRSLPARPTTGISRAPTRARRAPQPWPAASTRPGTGATAPGRHSTTSRTRPIAR